MEPEQLQKIENYYRKKPYELRQWIPITFYGNHDDEVICVLGGEQMQYASSDQTHYEELERFMAELNLEVL